MKTVWTRLWNTLECFELNVQIKIVFFFLIKLDYLRFEPGTRHNNILLIAAGTL